MIRILACFALTVVVVASPSFAQTPAGDSLPAVSQVNGKISLEGGATGSSGRSSAVGIAQGSLTAPLGHSFGVQVDGLAATSYDSLSGGGAAHLFWRNPQIGLFGPVAALAGFRGATVGWYGAEGEIYAPMFTIGAYGGYQDASLARLLASGGFYHGRLTVYPIPDLALTVGGGQYAGRTLGNGRIEYQPDFVASRNVSFFADGSAGDDSFYRVTGGVRLYFGPAKTLIRRHREDDPAPFTPGLWGNGGNGGTGTVERSGPVGCVYCESGCC
ncbi:MAG: hypothetical protein Q8M19_03285 [Reyranella sp.]|nr:hypothetical protein [Reyranella sp.]